MNSNKQTWRDELRESFEDTSFGGVVFPEVVDIVERALATYRDGVIKAIDTVKITETSADTKELTKLTRVLWERTIKPEILKAIKDMGI